MVSIPYIGTETIIGELDFGFNTRVSIPYIGTETQGLHFWLKNALKVAKYLVSIPYIGTETSQEREEIK